MNKKNTKIQGRANNIEEVMHIMRLLKEGKVQRHTPSLPLELLFKSPSFKKPKKNKRGTAGYYIYYRQLFL